MRSSNSIQVSRYVANCKEDWHLRHDETLRQQSTLDAQGGGLQRISEAMSQQRRLVSYRTTIIPPEKILTHVQRQDVRASFRKVFDKAESQHAH